MRVAVLTAGFSVGGGGRDYTPPSTAKAKPGVRSKAALRQSAEDRLLIPHSERSFELYCEVPVVHFGYLGVHQIGRSPNIDQPLRWSLFCP
jgi:hypothetical protein